MSYAMDGGLATGREGGPMANLTSRRNSLPIIAGNLKPKLHMDLDELKHNNLKALRPNLRQANLWCCKCRKQPDLWASYAMHFGGRDGELLSGEGAIHGQVQCHGDKEEILISFEVAHRYMAAGEKVPVFDNVQRFEPSRIIKPGSEDFRRLKDFNQ